jgi:arsenate reductase
VEDFVDGEHSLAATIVQGPGVAGGPAGAVPGAVSAALQSGMPTPTFFWKPSCTTCRNARRVLADRRVDVTERDINKEPPDRAFLERHIDEDRFLDFVSTRSPVFRQRPLPSTKKEAIDLMMEQPNLIKRPILVQGDAVRFGFDKSFYGSL